jgi:hypothetical protein
MTTWVVLQNQLVTLAQLSSFVHHLEEAFTTFYNTQKSQFPNRILFVPLVFRGQNGEGVVDPGMVIFSYLKYVLQLSLSEPNFGTISRDGQYFDLFMRLFSWTKEHSQNGKKNRIARLIKILCELTNIVAVYKIYVSSVFQTEDEMRKTARDRHIKFHSSTIEKAFSKDQSKINMWVNLLNQELQIYLPRLIPSPALHRRLDLARQDTFVALASISICNRAAWFDFKQSCVGDIILPNMKKKLVPTLFSHFSHDIEVVIVIFLVNFSKQFQTRSLVEFIV